MYSHTKHTLYILTCMSTPLVHYLSRMDIERMNEIEIVSLVLDIPRSCYMYEPSEYSMFIFIVSVFLFKLFIAKGYCQVVVKEVSEPLCCVSHFVQFTLSLF